MKITIATSEGVLSIEFQPATKEEPHQHDTQLDAMLELSEPHPEIDRPIGFRRRES